MCVRPRPSQYASTVSMNGGVLQGLQSLARQYGGNQKKKLNWINSNQPSQSIRNNSQIQHSRESQSTDSMQDTIEASFQAHLFSQLPTPRSLSILRHPPADWVVALQPVHITLMSPVCLQSSRQTLHMNPRTWNLNSNFGSLALLDRYIGTCPEHSPCTHRGRTRTWAP